MAEWRASPFAQHRDPWGRLWSLVPRPETEDQISSIVIFCDTEPHNPKKPPNNLRYFGVFEEAWECWRYVISGHYTEDEVRSWPLHPNFTVRDDGLLLRRSGARARKRRPTWQVR